MNTIISTKSLNVGYDKKTIVNQVNIEGLQGQMICLLGPNGSGKTTILRTLAGLLSPVGGCVEVNGNDIKNQKKSEIARQLSVVLTDAVTPRLTTVYDIVAIGRSPYTNFFGKLSDSDKEIIGESLRTVGAEHLKSRFISELSDGEKQKVMIARALVQEPRLIILDEPTSHLDIRHKVEVIRILQKLVTEKHITVILSLHDIDLAIKGCKTVLLIKDNEVVAQGSPEEVIHSGSIGELYDVSGAVYNELLGAVEIEGHTGNDVFVVAGNGTGINLYRALSREGYGVITGVLHENDIDTQIARTICSDVIVQSAFTDIGEDKFGEALPYINSVPVVIDTGFPIADGNKRNLELIKYAAAQGKTIYSLRKADNIIGTKINSINELFSKMEKK